MKLIIIMQKEMSAKKLQEPHHYHPCMSMQHFVSSTVVRILQILLIAEKFQAMSMDSSDAANCGCQNPRNMPSKHQMQKGSATMKNKQHDKPITPLTPSTIWGCPPSGLAAQYWFIPNPVTGVLATSSMSFIIDFKRATWISPNNLESCYQNGKNITEQRTE